MTWGVLTVRTGRTRARLRGVKQGVQQGTGQPAAEGRVLKSLEESGVQRMAVCGVVGHCTQHGGSETFLSCP